MRKTVASLLAMIMLGSTSSGALAQSQVWRLSEASGAVSIRHGAEVKLAARNAVLAPGDAVLTGAGGRAVLVHDRDFVTVSANSRVTVPLVQEATGFTRIVQDLGNAIFRIEKLKVPHFEVKTPYMAAVVKGTTFSVTIDRSGASLQVVEGAVEVATLDGGAKDLIRPGTVATIGASDLFRLQVQGDSAHTIDSPARPVDVPSAANDGAPVASTAQVTSVPLETVDAASTGFSPDGQVIGEAISSKPIDLASVTGGLMTGSTAAAPAILVASVKLETTVIAPGRPAENAASGQPASTSPTAADNSVASPPSTEVDVPVTAQPEAPTSATPAPAPAPEVTKADVPVSSDQASKPTTDAGKDATNAGDPSKGEGNPGKPEQADSPDKPGKVDGPDKPDKANGPDKPDKADGPDKPNKADGPDKPDKADGPDKPDKADGPDKPDKPDKADGPDKPDKADGPDKPDKADGPGKPDKADGPDKPDKADGPDKPDKADGPDKPDKANGPDKLDKADGPDKPDKPD